MLKQHDGGGSLQAQAVPSIMHAFCHATPVATYECQNLVKEPEQEHLFNQKPGRIADAAKVLAGNRPGCAGKSISYVTEQV